jgi:hypothetical protein
MEVIMAVPSYTKLVTRDQSTPKDKRCFGQSLFDSQLVLNGVANADLTIILRILFRRVDPSARGGRQAAFQRPGRPDFQLREISDTELELFKRTAVNQANDMWDNQLSLITPNECWLFDSIPAKVRPNVRCRFNCQVTEQPSKAHATILLIAPRDNYQDFKSFSNPESKAPFLNGVWDVYDTGVRHHLAMQDPAFAAHDHTKPQDILQFTVAHEVGHLLGLNHIGDILGIQYCDPPPRDPGDRIPEYGSDLGLPMWMAQDIMGLGSNVNPCDALPWRSVMPDHTGIEGHKWVPAQGEVPPTPFAKIPENDYDVDNSPQFGHGLNEAGKYAVRNCDI